MGACEEGAWAHMCVMCDVTGVADEATEVIAPNKDAILRTLDKQR